MGRRIISNPNALVSFIQNLVEQAFFLIRESSSTSGIVLSQHDIKQRLQIRDLISKGVFYILMGPVGLWQIKGVNTLLCPRSQSNPLSSPRKCMPPELPLNIHYNTLERECCLFTELFPIAQKQAVDIQMHLKGFARPRRAND